MRSAFLALWLAISTGPPVAATPPTFSADRLIANWVGLPKHVSTTDMDGDGDLDVLAAGYDGQIAWYENDGSDPPGPWTAHVVTQFANGAFSAVVARFDGDADLDFLACGFNSETVSWYENRSGMVPAWQEHPITLQAGHCFDVWAADMDADGDVDGLSASGFERTIVLYENGGGSPPAWTGRVVSTSDAGSTVQAADLDRDGDLDVVAGGAWYESSGGASPSFVMRTFEAAIVLDAVFVADLDADGDPDVLGASQQHDRIAWYESDGGSPPAWTPHILATDADFATSVYAADLDADTDLDVLSSSFDDDTIAWYENDGETPPIFTPHVISTGAWGARSVHAADLEGDGDVDVFSASQRDGNVVWYASQAGYLDSDADGMRDDLDCAPADPAAFALPGGVRELRFQTPTVLAWATEALRSGAGTVYDVVRGSLAGLPVGSGSSETCRAAGLGAPSFMEAADAPAASGFWYLVRGRNTCGAGSYGADSAGVPRSSLACP